MNGLLVRELLRNPTGQLSAEAVGATVGSVLTATAGGYVFQLPAAYIAPAYTYATLPASPTRGQTAVVTDSTVNTWGTAITMGGGMDVVLAWYTGSAWHVLGV